MALSLRRKQLDVIERMLHLNLQQQPQLPDGGEWQGEEAYKILVIDSHCVSILSPVLRVNDLRRHGVTLHLGIYRPRQAVPTRQPSTSSAPRPRTPNASPPTPPRGSTPRPTSTSPPPSRGPCSAASPLPAPRRRRPRNAWRASVISTSTSSASRRGSSPSPSPARTSRSTTLLPPTPTSPRLSTPSP